jgi:predicted 2-oxoglutarate/Fe(II)-dependent dioxygenase YbiX
VNVGNDRWLPGDRLPNVRLRSDRGEVVSLHADFAGKSLWLAVPSSADVAEQLPEPPAGVTALCLCADELPSAPPTWLSFFTDTQWLAGFDADVLWRTDTNLRLRDRYRLPLSQPKVAAVEEPTSELIKQPAAPVLLIPDVFEPELCARLIRHLEVDCGGGEPSRVLVLERGSRVLQLDPTIKQRRETQPRDAVLEERMHERLMRRALPEIARVFQFSVTKRDPFKLLAYPENAGYFRPHRDNETPDVAHRRFALSINLNAGDYVGGEFRYPEFGLRRYSPPTGMALVFSCSLLHEVLPVEQGTRYAMTTFLY